jgi:hypothetical protein
MYTYTHKLKYTYLCVYTYLYFHIYLDIHINIYVYILHVVTTSGRPALNLRKPSEILSSLQRTLPLNILLIGTIDRTYIIPNVKINKVY